MAYRASSVLPAKELPKLNDQIFTLGYRLVQYIAEAASGDINYEYIHILYSDISGVSASIDRVKVIPGILQYAKDQENDQAYDVVAEFTALETALDNTKTWLENGVPLSVTLRPIGQWSTNAKISNTFTPAQTTQLRTRLQSIVDLIA
jgi:hypothetical protein